MDSKGLVVPGLRRDTSDAASRVQIGRREYDMKTEDRNMNLPMRKEKVRKSTMGPDDEEGVSTRPLPTAAGRLVRVIDSIAAARTTNLEV